MHSLALRACIHGHFVTGFKQKFSTDRGTTIRSRDLLTPARRTALYSVPRSSLRHAGLLIWALPALAALALATLWLVTPGQPETGTESVVAPQQFANNADSSILVGSTRPRQENTSRATTPSKSNPAVKIAATDTSRDRSARTKSSIAAKSQTEIEQAVAGEWSGFYQGQRRLIVRAGGRATMVVEPEGLATVLLASKVTFEVRWAIKGDQFEFETVGGEPLDSVDVVVKMYGKRRSHKILDLQADKIVLLDEDGVTEYVWTRVPKGSAPESK